MPTDFTLRASHVVTPEGVGPATIVAREGRIVAVDPAAPRHRSTFDAGDQWILPGLVDTHVHVNEPGRTEWEGFETATRAAAAGGITTLADMPLNSIPATTSMAGLEQKRGSARGRCSVDVGFWGGVVPGNTSDLEPLGRSGVLGFKCFLAPSGVDEFPCVGEADLGAAMPVITRLGLPLLVHAELPEVLAQAQRPAAADPRKYATWLASRPPEAEVEAIRLMIRLADRFGCRVHVVHVATGAALPDLRRARAREVPITAETCPHYLFFAADEIRDGATALKCAPPIRERDERDALWAGLRDGTLDLIATDHSPCPPGLKQLPSGDFMSAWGGIASLEMALAAVWTAGRHRGATATDLARWMSAAPARLAGVDNRKGAIAPGRDADLVVFDPNAEWTVDPTRLQQRNKITPYAGLRLTGRVTHVFLRGEMIVDDGTVLPSSRGQFL